MKKTALLSVMFSILVLTLTCGPALAASTPIDVEVIPEEMMVESGDVADFELLIHNNAHRDIDFKFNVIGPYISWIEQPEMMSVEAHGSKTTNIILNPAGENPGVYEYNVSISALNYPYKLETIVKNFTMEVVNPVDIKAMHLSHSREQLNVILTLISLSRHEGAVVIDIIGTGGKSVKSETAPFAVDIEENFAHFMSFEGVLAGDYAVVARIEGTGIEASKEFTLEPVQDMQKTTEVEDSAFGREITVTVTNNGNIVEYDYKISEETSGVTGFVIKPVECYDAGGEKTVCATSIDRLEPGQTVTITYRIEYWPTYAGWLAGIVVVTLILAFSFIKVTAPRIRKRHISSRGTEHTVALEIKNPFSRKRLRNVIIRDWVSPLAKVVHREFESIRPIVRRTEAGTELIWKLGDIIGKEERVITYKLKGFVEGELKMPRAYLRYRDDKGKGSRVFSKNLIIS